MEIVEHGVHIRQRIDVGRCRSLRPACRRGALRADPATAFRADQAGAALARGAGGTPNGGECLHAPIHALNEGHGYAKKENADLLRDYTAQFIASVIARQTT